MVIGGLPPGSGQDMIANWFAEEGVPRDRLELLPRSGTAVYMQQHHRVDICLDTFPYTGHTTTIDALWMGVPVVTLVGDTAVSRGGLSILAQVGLENLCATNDVEFVEVASGLASDIARLAQLRSTLRQRLMSSPVGDVKQFTREIESAIRFAWRTWCDGN